MGSRTQLNILGISLIAIMVLAAACAPAAAPPPTPVPTKPAAVATPVPTTSVAAPVPAQQTAAPTVAPTKPVATPTVVASPTSAPRTPTAATPAPTKPAVPTAVPTKPAASATSGPGQGASDVVDCGTDLGCFINASRASRLAKVDYTMVVDFFGMFLANTDSLAIKGKDGDKLLFSQKTIAADAALTEAMIKAAQAKGMSDADVQKALTTAKGVAELMQAASVNVDPKLEQQLKSAKENQRARIGTGKECKFPQPALTAMLERWQQGKFSSSDYDPGQCTNLKAETAPIGASRPAATPAAGVPVSDGVRPTPTTGTGAAVAQMKDIPVPPGFQFESSGGHWGDKTFWESAVWTGKANMQEIADFYASRLAVGWVSRGGVVGDAILEARYDQENTNPVVALEISAEPGSAGVTLTLTLSNEKR